MTDSSMRLLLLCILVINNISSERLESSIQEPISQITENDLVDPGINGSEVVIEESTRPIIDHETSVKMVDNGGVVSMLEICNL